MPPSSAAIRGARRILEVGTLGGYSTIWFARAGFANVVSVVVGSAKDSLARLVAAPNVTTTAVQTAGLKGWDGFSISIVGA